MERSQHTDGSIASARRATGHPKRAEAIAADIEGIIMDRGWPVGEVLGSEPDLIDRFGVSRAVLREAVRIVEHHGAARMRRGPHGGLVVSAPDMRSVQRPMTLFLDYTDVSTSDLYTVRSTIELTCVELVAKRMDEPTAARLRDVLQAEAESGPEGIVAGVVHDFHVLVAELSGNVALALFAQTLANLTYERTHALEFETRETTEPLRAHTAIVEALIAGDASLAQHRMRAHLSASLAYYQQRSSV